MIVGTINLGDTEEEPDMAAPGNMPNPNRAPVAQAGNYPYKIIMDESAVFLELEAMMDLGGVEDFKQRLSGRSKESNLLRSHLDDIFCANTHTGSVVKQADWSMYCTIMYGRIPAVKDVEWPPSLELWRKFLMECRYKVSTYRRFESVVSNVVWVATRYWSRLKACSFDSIDPRMLYMAETNTMKNFLKHELGLGVNQVEAVTTKEARNVPHFVDSESFKGVAACAAFTMGCLMGGEKTKNFDQHIVEGY